MNKHIGCIYFPATYGDNADYMIVKDIIAMFCYGLKCTFYFYKDFGENLSETQFNYYKKEIKNFLYKKSVNLRFMDSEAIGELLIDENVLQIIPAFFEYYMSSLFFKSLELSGLNYISEYDNIKKAKLQDIVLYGYCDYAILYDEGLYVCYEQMKYGKLIETIKQKYKVSDVRIIY